MRRMLGRNPICLPLENTDCGIMPGYRLNYVPFHKNSYFKSLVILLQHFITITNYPRFLLMKKRGVFSSQFGRLKAQIAYTGPCKGSPSSASPQSELQWESMKTFLIPFKYDFSNVPRTFHYNPIAERFHYIPVLPP
jgi:hypothetical protein